MTPLEMYQRALETAQRAELWVSRDRPHDGQMVTGLALLANFYLQAAQVANNYPAWQQ